ncbi:hypothetical protein GIB67_028158, partial [Kingdonia uniflora]
MDIFFYSKITVNNKIWSICWIKDVNAYTQIELKLRFHFYMLRFHSYMPYELK